MTVLARRTFVRSLAASAAWLTTMRVRAQPADASTTVARLQAIAAGAQRSDAERARDVYRHPVETLAFFGIRDDMTVVEIWPGAGWYTRILAPFLKERGRLILAAYKPGPNGGPVGGKLREVLAAQPAVFGTPAVTVLDKGEYAIAPAGSVDLVLTFRNLHNWMDDDNAAEVLQAIHRALKPGGVLGLVEHRAAPGPQDPRAASGYVTEAFAIELAQAAGFKLAARSDINANPRDGKDHPQGVWTLPPTYALKDVDRAKYAAIGESDRMTLKFVKP